MPLPRWALLSLPISGPLKDRRGHAPQPLGGAQDPPYTITVTVTITVTITITTLLYYYTIILELRIRPGVPAAQREQLVAKCFRGKVQGKRLHTRSHKHDTPLEHATEHPLDNSSKHPLDE